MLRSIPRREGRAPDPVPQTRITMSLTPALVQTGYEYLAALLQELELFLAEPSWFRAFHKAHRAQRHMHRHVRVVHLFLEQQLAQDCIAEAPDTRHWRHCHEQAEASMDRLLAAVEERDEPVARQWLQYLKGHLQTASTRDLLVIEHLEARGRDLSMPLSNAIQGHTTP